MWSNWSPKGFPASRSSFLQVWPWNSCSVSRVVLHSHQAVPLRQGQGKAECMVPPQHSTGDICEGLAGGSRVVLHSHQPVALQQGQGKDGVQYHPAQHRGHLRGTGKSRWTSQAPQLGGSWLHVGKQTVECWHSTKNEGPE